jgi:hypothetical protein
MGTTDLGQLAVRACGRTRQEITALTFIALHPREITRLHRWLRERGAATMTLRSPWWPYDAISWVAGNLPTGARVFEYGGGGSTLWLNDRGAAVTVAEHHDGWYRQLVEALPPGVRVLLVPPKSQGTVTSAVEPGFFDDYAAAIDGEPDGSFDLVIVDGRARVDCARHAVSKVRPGGLLLLDDTERPRYGPTVEMLAGWERHVFTGLKPGSRVWAQTSAWKRPARG